MSEDVDKPAETMGLWDVPYVFNEMAWESRDAIIQWRSEIRELVEKRRLDKMKAATGEKPDLNSI